MSKKTSKFRAGYIIVPAAIIALIVAAICNDSITITSEAWTEIRVTKGKRASLKIDGPDIKWIVVVNGDFTHPHHFTNADPVLEIGNNLTSFHVRVAPDESAKKAKVLYSEK